MLPVKTAANVSQQVLRLEPKSTGPRPGMNQGFFRNEAASFMG
jgi:hypothetical protein